MKIRIAKILVLIGAMSFTLNTHAQQYLDYVITVKGDTIPCNIFTRLLGTHIYQSEKMTKPEKITTETIKEYYVEDENVAYRAVFKDSTKSALFLRIVENGEISVYEDYGSGGYATPLSGSYTYTIWYIGKGGGQIITVQDSGGLFWKKLRDKYRAALWRYVKRQAGLVQ